jgi:hypothetical protein
MSDQGGDTRFEMQFRLDAALIRIKALEKDIVASEHNFRTMRQSRNDAAARIEALEAALRQIIEAGDFWEMDSIARAALAPEQDK